MRSRRADATMFPVVLSAQGAVGIGNVFTPNASDLQNSFQRDIQIEEIRFLLSIAPAQIMGTLAGLVRVKLSMGRLDLTNGYVPIWLLGTRYQAALEKMGGGGAGNPAHDWEYARWKLPRPMIVPSGSTLMATFTYLMMTGGQNIIADPNDTPISVWVALVGRSSPEGFTLPATIDVPYATAWIPKIGEAASGNDTLVNKFSAPLYIQRFVGRMASSPANPYDAEVWSPVDAATADAQVAGLLIPNVTLKGSNGYDIVGEMTAWDDVFNPARCALEAGIVMQPREWFTARIDAPPIPPAGPVPGMVVPGISMIGWREEELVL